MYQREAARPRTSFPYGMSLPIIKSLKENAVPECGNGKVGGAR